MSAIFIDNTVSVIARVNSSATLSLRELTGETLRTSKGITPRDDGDLRANVIQKSEGERKRSITWASEYAAYQERGRSRDGRRVVKKYTTPGTGKEYAKRSVDKTIQDAPNIMRRVL